MDDLDSNNLSNAQNDACQSQKASEEAEAVMAMKEKLPKYVMDSFIAAGFDTLKVISEIDTSSDNDLQEIQQFITDECKKDTRFKPGFGVSGHFKFLPGHRRRIINFINGLKQEAAKNKLKRPKQTTDNECPLVIETKKIKLESNLESTASTDQTTCINPEHQATIAAKIRQQVAKWQRSQNLDKLRELKEIKHFDVNVDVKGERDLSLSITCNICGSNCFLSHKNKHILISNWTRHVSKCVEKTRKPISNSKIKDFFYLQVESIQICQRCLFLSHRHLFHRHHLMKFKHPLAQVQMHHLELPKMNSLQYHLVLQIMIQVLILICRFPLLRLLVHNCFLIMNLYI